MTARAGSRAASTLFAALMVLLSSTAGRAQTAEFFDHATFGIAAGPTTTIDFDALAPCDGCLTGTEFTGQGLTIVQRDGLAMNIVRNLVPGGFGGNFVTEANVSSPPHVLSSSILTTSAHDISDNFDFIFSQPMRSAGLFIGNVATTTVQFLDADGGVIVSRTLTTASPGIVFGPTGEIFDNRIFYGIVSATPIHRVRVIEPGGDGDGLTFDDVEFSPAQVEFVPSTAKVWIGLKNSDAVGLRLDVQAEVFAEDLMVGTGQISNVPAGGSGFNNAQLRAIALAATPLGVADGAPLDLRVSVRRTCSGTGHQSGVVRLWYDGPAIDSGTQRNAGSRLEAILDEATVSYYLRTGSALSEAAGTVRTYRDVAVDSSQPCPSRPFTPFGTWSIELD